MTTVLTTGPDIDPATHYLTTALQHHTQAEIARYLKVSTRAVRHWIAKQDVPECYRFGLQRLLQFDAPPQGDAPFTFCDFVRRDWRHPARL